MRLGLYLKDNGISGVDLSRPEEGNPGIGGTEYCFSMLGRYLNLYYSQIEIIYYHYNDNRLPAGTIDKRIATPKECIQWAKKDSVDLLIFANNEEHSWYLEIQNSRLHSIVWAHCYIGADEAKTIAANPWTDRVVFVGKEEYDFYIDHDIIKKSAYIFNMYEGTRKEYTRTVNKQIVTYIGSLTKYKGFNEIAKIWKSIILQVPEAELHVIGSGRLYNRSQTLGRYGLAESAFEKKFISYLVDENKQILKSVKFHGLLGKEKKDVLSKTKVGVVNPSAKSETFCLSAVEMEAFGIPVVSRKKNGLIDTIVDGKTGILFRSRKGLYSAVLLMLKNDNFNNQCGKAAKKFVTDKFAPEKLIHEWAKLLNEAAEGVSAGYAPVTGGYCCNKKWLHLCIRFIRIRCGIAIFPSYLDISASIQRLLKKGLNLWKS